MRLIGTSPPYENNDMLPNSQKKQTVSHEITGILKHEKQIKNVYPDLTLIKNHPDYIFAHMPFISSAVKYTLYVNDTSFVIHHQALNSKKQARKMNVVRSSWIPRKLTIDLLRKIYTEEDLSWTKDSELTFKKYGIMSLSKAHPNSLGLRLLAFHDPIRILAQARDYNIDPPFSLQTILDLSNDQIILAADLMKNDPFKLCFRETHGLNLPDMYPDLRLMTLSPLQRKAHNLYLKIKKNTYENCHSLMKIEFENKSMDDQAISLLISNGIVVRSKFDDNFISLVQVVRQEQALIEAIYTIESSPSFEPAKSIGKYNDDDNDDDDDDDDYYSSLQLSSGHKMCDEQKKAFMIMLKKPILAIDGSAGSGKTDFLNVIDQVYGKVVYFTAFQGVNAGQLSRISENASTTHKLLYEHSQHHNLLKCIFKDINVLVIDEVGTQSLSLFSAILSAFANCGRINKKLILVGDLGQLPPIGGPAPFRYLLNYFNARASFIKFMHNHRVKDDSDLNLLATNAIAIRAGNKDEIYWDSNNFIFESFEDDDGSGKSPINVLMKIIDKFDLIESRFIVVTHQRKHVEILCKEIEKKFGGTGTYGIQTGHKFAFTKNAYDIGVINNEILWLHDIEDREISKNSKRSRSHHPQSTTDRRLPNTNRYLIAHRKNGAVLEIPYEKSIIGRVKKASAVTSNAMQGSSYETVIRVDFCKSIHSTRERLYTDVTRAENRFIYIGNLDWFDEAILRPETIPESHLEKYAEELNERLILSN